MKFEIWDHGSTLNINVVAGICNIRSCLLHYNRWHIIFHSKSKSIVKTNNRKIWDVDVDNFMWDYDIFPQGANDLLKQLICHTTTNFAYIIDKSDAWMIVNISIPSFYAHYLYLIHFFIPHFVIKNIKIREV